VNTLASRLGFSARTRVAPACGCPVSVRDARTRYARVRAHVRALNGIKSARLIAQISVPLGMQRARYFARESFIDLFEVLE